MHVPNGSQRRARRAPPPPVWGARAGAGCRPLTVLRLPPWLLTRGHSLSLGLRGASNEGLLGGGRLGRGMGFLMVPSPLLQVGREAAVSQGLRCRDLGPAELPALDRALTAGGLRSCRCCSFQSVFGHSFTKRGNHVSLVSWSCILPRANAVSSVTGVCCFGCFRRCRW